MSRLPTRLRKDPLVTVVFELRFTSDFPASKILPGILFSQLGCSNLQNTPHSEIPESIRTSDPNLVYAPLVILQWGEYQIQIGDKSLQLACEMPYKGWCEFKKHIMELLIFIKNLGVIKGVERYSLKYIDIIDYKSNGSFKDLLDIDLKFGRNDFNIAGTQIRTEANYEDTIVIMNLIGQARADFPNGSFKSGFLIDIDCIKPLNHESFMEIVGNFPDYLEDIHDLNKNIFFGYLTEEGLEHLEAEYE